MTMREGSVPVGFIFEPQENPDGCMRVAMGATEPACISFHGDQVRSTRIDGEPIVEGRQYQLRDGMRITAGGSVAVHIEPHTVAPKLPDGVG